MKPRLPTWLTRQRGAVGATVTMPTVPAQRAGVLVSVRLQLPERVAIRQYRPADRPAIRALCCATGLRGGPIQRVFPDCEAFADLHTDAYLDHQPDLAWVATASNELLGYLLGAERFDFGLWIALAGARAVLRMRYRLRRGDYAGYPLAADYVDWLLYRALREQPRHPRVRAHMHFNVVPGARGQGIAYALWRCFESRLCERGKRGYYGVLLSYPGHRPERVYVRYGLRVFDRRPTTLFRAVIPQPAELVCVTKEL